MSLLAGSRLGAYEVISLLGAGGMGEVYRAVDTDLKREVALKVLPSDVASNIERVARFQREAEVLASLNHPNIGHLYGIERTDGVLALAMELVEGPTLQDRIAEGRIPVDEALSIARQIADALEAAHEQGIIHRDLKPANIKVRDDGTVKVLDFGLAKAMEPIVSASAAGALTNSPTITSPALMTGVGMLLGTAAYMSPEQARGRPADKRSDIWAFGVVLYEMLCGERLFKGDDVAETLAAVLRLDVNWSALPAATPSPVRSLLERCLNRDTKRRLRDIGEARIVLAEPTSPAFGAELPAAMRGRRPMWQRSLATVVSGVLIGIISGAAVWWATRAPAPGVVRFSLVSTGLDDAAGIIDRTFAIAPDGATVVYAADNGTRLLARALDRLEPRVIASGVGLRGVAVSPDGLWVAFVDGSSVLKKVAITGGPAVTLAAMGAGSRGVAWVADDAVVFATNSTASGLQRVSAAGGEPVVLTTADTARGEGDHWWPEMLPGGESLLFTIVSPNERPEDSQVAILNIHTGRWEVVLRGADRARYVPTGHLVYGVSGTLYAVPFDLGRLAVTGAAAPVLQGVMSTSAGSANVAFASNGSLVYIAGTAKGGSQQTVARFDRGGHGASLEGLPPDSYRDVRLSPDGSQLALATQDDVFVYDFRRRTRSRLTTDPAPDRSPLWTPDSQRIVFTSRRAGSPELFWRLADGSGDDQLLYAAPKGSTDVRANGWSSDGDLLYTEVSGGNTGLIRRARLGDFSNARLLVTADSPSPLSPHGGWMAYQSNVSGSLEVYVERDPEIGDRKLISRGGGVRPVWSADGRELFYTNGRQMIAVPIEYGATLVAGIPRALFDVPVLATAGNRPYEVTGDGNFLIIVGT